jgi:hypothetical protein
MVNPRLAIARLTNMDVSGPIFTHATCSQATGVTGACVDYLGNQPVDVPRGKTTVICPGWDKDPRHECTLAEPPAGD